MTNFVGTEAQLMASIKSGQSSAFRKLYTDYFGMIRYMIVNNNGSEEEAQDIFQEAMVVLYEKVNEGNFELTSTLKTWIYAVCRNKWLKQLEKKKKNYRFTDFENFDETIAANEEEETNVHALLRESLSRLGTGCRKLLLLFYYFRKSMDEIATELNYTNADNAKSQKYKCIQKLKTIYAERNANG